MALGLTDRSDDITAGSVSQEVMAANIARKLVLFQNISTATMWLNFGAAATANSNSFKILPDQCFTFEMQAVVAQAVHVICATIASKYVAKEG